MRNDSLQSINQFMSWINGYLWHDSVLFTVLGLGVFFMLATKLSPILSIFHGTQVVRGKYDDKDAPGAISHFQALSAALSASVGLGNIGGVAIAIALGGPGAVFWMWVVGFVGMSIKTVEVTQSMLFRNVDHKEDPHGGPMYVAKNGFKEFFPDVAWIGGALGTVFCVMTLVSTATGGNMFQAWNVSRVTLQNFGVPEMVTGVILAVATGLVIIGGIKRIGSVASALVPTMCGIYLFASLVVIIININMIPEMLALIVKQAFSATSSQGAFVGGTAGYAFLWGMKRALFSNEAGQGSSPMAHSAVKTSEPVREGIVAGLEPFIDTLVVCTLTALVILSTGAWNRPAKTVLTDQPVITVSSSQTDVWNLSPSVLLPEQEQIFDTTDIFMHVRIAEKKILQKVSGEIIRDDQSGQSAIVWSSISSLVEPSIVSGEIFEEYAGAQLTSYAFDQVYPGLGTWLVTLASWLFAISTIISWSYYGEQAMVYLFGEKSVLFYRLSYCGLILIATSGFLKTSEELDNLTGIGTGVMLLANVPIMIIFSTKAIGAYHDYRKRLNAGDFDS